MLWRTTPGALITLCTRNYLYLSRHTSPDSPVCLHTPISLSISYYQNSTKWVQQHFASHLKTEDDRHGVTYALRNPPSSLKSADNIKHSLLRSQVQLSQPQNEIFLCKSATWPDFGVMRSSQQHLPEPCLCASSLQPHGCGYSSP